MIELPNKIKNDLSGNLTNAQYLVAIQTDPVIYISTTKQMFEGIENDNIVYYEDLDLKVSNIKEKIDLKTKKIQLSSMSLSFNNFPVNDVRLSDRMGNGLGKEISVYLKTASCESIEDCVKVADLKVNRYSHDKNTVKISADDKWLESFYIDLPKTLLKKDVNTFEAYNLKPVPILYGHLENAPALPYYEEGEDYSFVKDGIKILPDSYYLNENAEIQGIKQWNNQGGLRKEEEMKDPNIFKVKISDSIMASIPVVPYLNTRDQVKNLHTAEQYKTYNDYISITSLGGQYSASYSNISNLVSMWCSYNSKLINEKKSAFSVVSKTNEGLVSGEEKGQINNPTFVEGDTFKYLSSGWKYTRWEFNYDTFQNMLLESFLMWNFGLYELEFEPLNGVDVYRDEISDEPTVSDVNIIGDAFYRYTWSGNESFVSFKSIAIYSPVKYDDEYQALPNGNLHTDKNLGTPSSWNFIDDSDYNLFSSSSGDGWLDVLESKDRNTFEIKGLEDDGSGFLDSPSQYTSYFNSKYSNINKFNSFYSNNEYPIIQSNNVSIYYTITDEGMSQPNYQSDNGDQAEAKVWMETKWNNVELRKYWKNKDIFSKGLFVNAKGRIGSTVNNSIDVQAEIKVFYEGTNEPSDFTSHENKHLIELYKALTDSSMKYKNIGGEVYELMLYHKILGSQREHYLYDIDVNNFGAKTDINSLDDFNSVFTDNNGVIQPYYGWIFEVTAKNFGGSHLPNSQSWTNEDVSFFGGFNLIYGKINYSNGDINSITVSTDDTLNEFNSSNSFQDMNATGKSYVKIYHESDEVSRKLLESPEDIIANLVSTEMGLDQISISIPTQESNMKFGFSINEQESSKDIIENICSQSNLFFRYNPRDGQAIIDTVKRSYSNGDVDKTIATDRILKYSFGKTKIDDLCFGGCTVKWGYDYGKEELANITEPRAVTGDFIDQYLVEYGVEDSEKYKLEIEAPYINNLPTAEKFRDFMFQFYKNTHLTIKATLPIQEGIELEVGDVVGFDSNIGGLKPYGRDMYQSLYDGSGDGYMLIDQRIYPYFLITSVSKTLDKVDIEVMQLHNLIGIPVVEEDDTGTDTGGDTGDDTGDDVQPDPIYGCTNPNATNYNPDATDDDGSCILPNNAPVANFEGYAIDPNGEYSAYVYTHGGYMVLDPSTSFDIDGEIVEDYWSLTVSKDGVILEPNHPDYPTDLLVQVHTQNETSPTLHPLVIAPLPEHAGINIGLELTVTDDDGATASYGSTTGSIRIFSWVDAEDLPEEDDYAFYVEGDVNGDGTFNVLDIQAVANYISGNSELTEDELRRADIVGDGVVDILDLVEMVSRILGED